jgi:hypothetical protein
LRSKGFAASLRGKNIVDEIGDARHLSRRTLASGVAWAAPVLSAVACAPAYAASAGPGLVAHGNVSFSGELMPSFWITNESAGDCTGVVQVSIAVTDEAGNPGRIVWTPPAYLTVSPDSASWDWDASNPSLVRATFSGTIAAGGMVSWILAVDTPCTPAPNGVTMVYTIESATCGVPIQLPSVSGSSPDPGYPYSC